MSRKVLHLIKLYLSFFVCFIRHAVRSIIYFFVSMICSHVGLYLYTFYVPLVLNIINMSHVSYLTHMSYSITFCHLHSGAY